MRDFGAVFRPFGFHLADAGFFGFDVKAVFLPECFQQRPNFSRGFALDFNPTLVAVALQTDAFDGFEDFGVGGLLGCRCAAAQVAGADGAAACGYLIEVALIGVVQIRRYF